MTNIGFYFTYDQNSYNVMDHRVVGNALHLQTKAVGTHTVMLQKSHITSCHQYPIAVLKMKYQ